MIEFSPKNIKNWSTIGPRATFGQILFEIAKEINDLIIVTADVSTSAGLDRFRKTYPQNFVDTGISEQNMMGIAAGLADNDFKVFTTTFAPFQTLRCCEQIKVNLAYSGLGVTMVGLASGLVNGPLGNTHCCIEDIGVLRSIPNITIVSPADGLSVAKSVLCSIGTKSPIYIRLTGAANNPIVYEKDVNYKLGEFIELRSGVDISIFASGSMVYNSLCAADILLNFDIHVTLYDAHTIKPIDQETVLTAARRDKLIVTVEEHNIIGGLGSGVAECLTRVSGSARLLTLGVNDIFMSPGEYSYMQEQAGLLPQQIAGSILKSIKAI